MTIEKYEKLLDEEGHEISYVEDGWIFCSPYSFDVETYGWNNGEPCVAFENEWRNKLQHISETVEFGYSDFTDSGRVFYDFEVRLYVGDDIGMEV